MAQHDMVIRSGSVIDGTGREAFTADVAIKDGLIVEVGKVSGAGQREVDADGALVTPGFVDIHTHYDGQATWSNRMSPSSHHGVTSVVMGNCGVGFAPVRPTDHDLLIELMEGVEDIPGVALSEGLSWEWESFPDYLDYLSKRQFDMDIGAQLPHAALRVYVMGQRGADREPATAEDVLEMRRLTEEAIRAGALGFTSSRTLNHRSVRGEPTPTLQAEYDELVGMASALHSSGRGVMEMISDFDDLDEEFSLLESMVRSAGRPMSISLAQGISDHGWRKVLGKIESASNAGLAMRGQVAPRPIGILLGLTTTLSPFTTRPSFSEVATLPMAERVAALTDPMRKARILEEPTGHGFMRLFRLMDEGRKIWLMTDPPNYEPDPKDSLHAQATSRGLDPWSYVYDMLLQNQGKALLYTPFANYAENNLDCCRDMILHKDTVMGLGDGGAHVGTICDASFITSLLTHWGRDRTRGEGIDLPTLIKCQSSDTARAVDLTDRGTLEAGMRADVNIIDFDNLNVRLPEMVNDLPAGGARLQQRADGYQMTIVKGEPTYIEGQATDALPGRLVRKTHSHDQ
ncbi:MAG: amidohydrolase family protein [Pseudomonadales bacterium]|jgi:N-acyl-D-aspartate/D-glutamate deacylase|nr:amidohydrolase [Gammaproteobacteria bacterium]MCH1597997.1 amidohydrolase family protein [Pseudomonadales bacterium]RPG31882.1 MAG: D-aminoacylase [Gammaproteobacteria bacterium TMED243]